MRCGKAKAKAELDKRSAADAIPHRPAGSATSSASAPAGRESPRSGHYRTLLLPSKLMTDDGISAVSAKASDIAQVKCLSCLVFLTLRMCQCLPVSSFRCSSSDWTQPVRCTELPPADRLCALELQVHIRTLIRVSGRSTHVSKSCPGVPLNPKPSTLNPKPKTQNRPFGVRGYV